jgi:hypothetical protein
MKKLFLSILTTSLVIGSLAEVKVSAQRPGVITGALSYPTDTGLPNMIVCAEAADSKSLHCTDKRITNRRTRKVTYKLTLPAGSYYVFAILVNGEEPGEAFEGYKAYYSEFVICGLSVNCPSHEPFKITLRAGQTLTGIDPGDWYVDN